MNTPTPRAERLHIAFFGRRNSGKSSLINALTGQQSAIVSDTPGTTTDPVLKAMEIHGLGATVLIDTPGFDDEGELGAKRVAETRKILDKTDLAVLLIASETPCPDEIDWFRQLQQRNIPTVVVRSKADRADNDECETNWEHLFGQRPLRVSATNKTGLSDLREALIRNLPEDYNQPEITGELASAGDVVMLVMPQDIQAPKGRLILPQVQTIRELLDKKCRVVCCTTDQIEGTLASLAAAPKLIITDSQVFSTVYALKPAESLLTSFSVLFARYKGDIDYFVESAAAIGQLTENSRVLIAEACTHAPLTEDIGREKIPAMLRKRIGKNLQVEIVSGTDFPSDLTPYDLVIHCGACMFNRRHVLSRVAQARTQHVPMTNYGVSIAYLQGILDKIEY
ncbi:MAG TPA: [FeFe] hydrogenase H-cluster maturation GTPase HydF [Candidatus Alistipes avicola]|uniref:[FeFe] hydrogenase H-cluster maturation GTPase HydF n=1 Tax=Candidatus Alistipes avicola TaxID=2838432 RepID=A0A9D2L419_9BACT|nr:[FeFe] hydrogenase H-cluster maturation GTPase HydF [uncultured Alistipes sp.]HJA98871.1 [FeFe] hydrogenase H-cluster maturation GTPase HydF [Candidatus Alistipes avicola]